MFVLLVHNKASRHRLLHQHLVVDCKHSEVKSAVGIRGARRDWASAVFTTFPVLGQEGEMLASDAVEGGTV